MRARYTCYRSTISTNHSLVSAVCVCRHFEQWKAVKLTVGEYRFRIKTGRLCAALSFLSGSLVQVEFLSLLGRYLLCCPPCVGTDE